MLQLARQQHKGEEGCPQGASGLCHVTFDFIFLCQLRKLPSFHNAWKTNQNGAASGTYESPTRWPGGKLAYYPAYTQREYPVAVQSVCHMLDHTTLPIGLARCRAFALFSSGSCHMHMSCEWPQSASLFGFLQFLGKSQSWKCVTSCCHLFISQINITHTHRHTRTPAHREIKVNIYRDLSICESDELWALFWTLKLKCQQK